MPIDLWLGFVAASALLLLTPGPVVTLLVATGISLGRGAALAMIPGILLGDVVALTLSLLGVGSLLMVSAMLFTVVKWLGAAYLVWLGVRMWREAAHLRTVQVGAVDPRAMRRHGFLINVLNPKSILFFLAFLPQFVDPQASVPPQLALLGATFLVLGLIANTAWAAAAGSAARLLGIGVRRAIHRAGGAAMIVAGVLTAGLRRA